MTANIYLDSNVYTGKNSAAVKIKEKENLVLLNNHVLKNARGGREHNVS